MDGFYFDYFKWPPTDEELESAHNRYVEACFILTKRGEFVEHDPFGFTINDELWWDAADNRWRIKESAIACVG